MPLPSTAKKAMSFWMSAKSASPDPSEPTFSTAAPVDCTWRVNSLVASTICLISLDSGKYVSPVPPVCQESRVTAPPSPSPPSLSLPPPSPPSLLPPVQPASVASPVAPVAARNARRARGVSSGVIPPPRRLRA